LVVGGRVRRRTDATNTTRPPANATTKAALKIDPISMPEWQIKSSIIHLFLYTWVPSFLLQYGMI
jgi:hypothetical protein